MSIRYRQNDVLSVMLLELCASALALPLFDSDKRENWRVQCWQLLEAVHPAQLRLDWTMVLAEHLRAGSGVPVPMGIGYLLPEEEA